VDLDGYLLHAIQVKDALPALQRQDGQVRYNLANYIHYRTDLTGSFEDFLKTKASKTRSTLRRKIKKFAEAGRDGELEWSEYHRPEELARFFELALPLARTTYQAKLFDGALPDTSAFYDQSYLLAAQGQLRCYLLFLNQAPVAYLYLPIEERTAIYTYLGYDEELSALSPGTVLQYLVHEHLFADPDVDWFDFTEGDGSHKALFATERITSCNILCLRDNFRHRMLVKLHMYWNRMIFRIKQQMGKQ
jgi:CelD/BcsL family acetyltransferase involved in cellulose biosynthesis